MVRRRQTQLTIAQVVLFGSVVPEVEQLMVDWVREVDRALDADGLVDGVLAILRRRWRWPQSSRRGRHGGNRRARQCSPRNPWGSAATSASSLALVSFLSPEMNGFTSPG
jgi:hypothetical protein